MHNIENSMEHVVRWLLICVLLFAIGAFIFEVSRKAGMEST